MLPCESTKFSHELAKALLFAQGADLSMFCLDTLAPIGVRARAPFDNQRNVRDDL